MATRNPADVSQPNFKSVDWYEPYRGQTVQKAGGVTSRFRNSAEVYGHDTWDAVNGVVVPVAPLMVEYDNPA